MKFKWNIIKIFRDNRCSDIRKQLGNRRVVYTNRLDDYSGRHDHNLGNIMLILLKKN